MILYICTNQLSTERGGRGKKYGNINMDQLQAFILIQDVDVLNAVEL